MASAASCWEVLRICGLSDIAPACIKDHVVTLDAARENQPALLREGVQRWQLEVLLAAVLPVSNLPECCWFSSPAVSRTQGGGFE